MPSRIGAGLILPDSQTRSLSPGNAELARSLGGLPRELWELIRGESAVAGEEPITPTNPQGGIGYDWSGPPWGSAPVHPIAYFSAVRTTTANLAQPAARLTVGSKRPLQFTWHLHNRKHDALPQGYRAPYSRACIALRSFRSSGSATPTVTVKARNIFPLGQTVEEGVSDTYTGPTGTEATERFSNLLRVDLAPGRNVLGFQFSHSGASTVIVIASMLLYNIVKRSH